MSCTESQVVTAALAEHVDHLQQLLWQCSGNRFQHRVTDAPELHLFFLVVCWIITMPAQCRRQTSHPPPYARPWDSRLACVPAQS
jgi:hypothetical protein